MIGRVLFALLFVTTAFDTAAAADGSVEPSTNLLFQLEKQNRRHPWLHVTTDSTRLTLRVDRIDQRGLRGFTAPTGALPPPRPLPWAEIERIDEVVTRAGQGRILGGIALGLAGAGLGNAIGAPEGNGGQDALVGFMAGAAIGRWLGGRYGERFQQERNWYVADPARRRAPNAPPAIAVAVDSVLDGATPADSMSRGPAPAAPSVAASAAAIRAAERIGGRDVIRVEGDFGRFQGFASAAGPQGLEGLRVDRKARGEWATLPRQEAIAWETIDEVRMRGGSGLAGGLVGAASFGVFGALVGAAAVAVSSTSNTNPAAGAALGAVILAPAGFVLGLASGSLARRWVVVYRRP